MKILQISHKMPYPPLDGGSIVINSLTNGLLSLGHQVKVLAMLSPKRNISADEIDKEYRRRVDLATVEVDTRLRPLGALKNLLFEKESYHTSRFESTRFSDLLRKVLQAGDFDIVQLESIFVLRYVDVIRKYSKAKVVLRTQNVEHLIWEGLVSHESNPIKKWYLNILTKRLKKYELEKMRDVDAIIPITDYDAGYLAQQNSQAKTLTAIPFGIDVNKFLPERKKSASQKKHLFHLGSMDWRPNLEAVDWFLEKVWLNSDLNKKTKLYLAGKFMPQRIKNLADQQLIVEDQIDFPLVYMSDKKIMIVPLLSGSGIRVKIIEGMALGKIIITTTVGANGINYIPNHHLIIADTPEEFEAAIYKCLADDQFCSFISHNAQALIDQEYSELQIARRFIQFYQKLMN